jgi:hypothetical protein
MQFLVFAVIGSIQHSCQISSNLKRYEDVFFLRIIICEQFFRYVLQIELGSFLYSVRHNQMYKNSFHV